MEKKIPIKIDSVVEGHKSFPQNRGGWGGGGNKEKQGRKQGGEEVVVGNIYTVKRCRGRKMW